MTNERETRVEFREFSEKFGTLEGLPLSHVDMYFQKIDLHFGKYQEADNNFGGEYVVYVSGFWEVLDSGKTVLDESYEQAEIAAFFENQLGFTVVRVTFFEETLDFYLELSNRHTLYVKGEQDGRWIELLAHRKELLSPTEKGSYIYKCF